MNESTLWLQVPAAKIQPINYIGLTSSADKLEDIASRLASLQNNQVPVIEQTNIILFVADHGIVFDYDLVSAKGINSTPPVSEKLLGNFSATSDTNHQLTKTVNAHLEVINLGTTTKFKSIEGIANSKIDSSTANFCHAPAMNSEQLAKAINVGRQSAQRMKLNGAHLFVAREINKANTLSAWTMTCALLDLELDTLAEVNTEQKQLIQKAFVKHKEILTSPLEILRCLGSFEIAALTGSYLCCAHMGMPVLIDGFASAVAALVATKLCPNAEQWFLYSATPNNAAHKIIYKKLNAQPLLQTDQSLDSLAGITMSLSLLQLACASHNETLNFTEENRLKRYS